MLKSSLAAVAAFLFLGLSASAQGYMQVDGVPGESLDERYPAWIEITSLSEGIDAQIAQSAGSARSVSRAVVRPVVVTKAVDTTTPVFRSAVATGKSYKTINIVFGRLTLKLEDVVITSAGSFSAEDSAVEDLQLVASKTTWSVAPVDRAGAPGKPVQSTFDSKAGKAN